MAGVQAKNKLKTITGIDLAPMVDIVFLLVTYFLINSTLEKKPAIKVQLPQSTTAQSERQHQTVIFVDNLNQVYLNERKVELKSLPAEIKKQIKDPKSDYVIIKGDRNASYQIVISIIDYVNRAGIRHFNLATQKR